MAIVSANGAATPLSPNVIINGAMDVWQRGSSFSQSGTSDAYTADRWRTQRDGSSSVVTVSRQSFTPGSMPVGSFEPQYFLRVAQTTAGTGGTYNSIIQHIEDVRTFAGQTVTLSFWAKADSTRTIQPMFLQRFGEGGVGGSADSLDTKTAITIGTTWQRYSATYTIAGISGKTIVAGSSLALYLLFANNVVQTIDIWGIQLELGSVATPFRRNANSLQGELAACQRYYLSTNPLGLVGHFYSSTQASYNITFPVAMRVAPSISFGGGAFVTYSASASGRTTTMSVVGSNTIMAQFVGTLTNTSTTSGYSAHLDNGTVNSLVFNAEH